MIKRTIEENILKDFGQGKAVIVYGPRQVGKTTLMKSLLDRHTEKWLLLNCDEQDVKDLLTHTTSSKLKASIGDHKHVLIDEAQRIVDIGITLKLFTDQIKDVQVIATGSSSFELANRVNEPLTGRKFEHFLFPLSIRELIGHTSFLEENRLLDRRLIYGYYPEIVTSQGGEQRLLQLLADSYLFKDLLSLENIKKPSLLYKILRALALQLGNEVSFNEIAQLVGADFQTVEKYIDLLQKAFIIFMLPAFSKNVRNEIRKSRKIYFYDCGIRNAIILNYRPLESRNDVGALWENFLISERMKMLTYTYETKEKFFWRTTQQQEIDYLEQDQMGLKAFEFKWNVKAKAKFPKTFTRNYEAETKLITPANYQEFLDPVYI